MQVALHQGISSIENQDDTYLPWRKFRLQDEVEISEENWKEYSSRESVRIRFQMNSEYSYLEEIKKSLIKEIQEIHVHIVK